MAMMCVSLQVSRAKGPLELVKRPCGTGGRGRSESRSWLGICHNVDDEGRPDAEAHTRVPGHEVAGMIDAAGPGVPGGASRVGVGWNGGYCGYSDASAPASLAPASARSRASRTTAATEST